MAELLSRLLPFRSNGQIVHGERWVSSNVLLDLEEGRQSLSNLVILQGGASFKEDKSLAASMTRGIVDVKLIMLAVIEEGSTSLEHWQMVVIP